MKLHLILEDDESLILEEAFQNGIINEDVGGAIDNVAEIVFGTVGLAPGLGEPADFTMGVKCLVQKDYFGAACFFISMIPEAGDAIGKPLRMAHKLIKATGKEKEANAVLKLLVKNTPNGKLTEYAMALYKKASELVLTGTSKKAEEATKVGAKAEKKGNKNGQKVRYAGQKMNIISRFIAKKIELMKGALENGIAEIISFAKEAAAPKDELGDVPGLADDLAGGIDETYRKMFESDPSTALRYKRMVKNNAKRRGVGSAHHQAYDKVFYDKISEV